MTQFQDVELVKNESKEWNVKNVSKLLYTMPYHNLLMLRHGIAFWVLWMF